MILGSRRVRWPLTLLTVLVAAYFSRFVLLPPVARFLDVSEAPAPVNDVLVLGGGHDTRPFIAAALIKSGKARNVLIPSAKLSPDAKRRIRGSESEIIRRILLARGVPANAIVELPGEVNSTADEAHSLGRFLENNPSHTVVIVTNTFHTRRARWIFQRVLGDRASQVHFVAAPTDGFDENNWWQSDDGFKCYAEEYVKLGLYLIRL